MKDLTVVPGEPGYHCPRCELEYEPDVINISPFCGRCGYDIGGTIDLSEDLTTEDDLKGKAGATAKADLMLMLDNWYNGYVRVLGDDVNWSLVDEFAREVIDQMFPYIARLKGEGYIDGGDVTDIGNHFGVKVSKFTQALEQNEELMRLTGQWDDNEQEIKEYWQNALGKLYELPVRFDTGRVASD